MKGKLHQVQCDEEEVFDFPDNWIPVRLERNAYWTQGRKNYTLFLIERT